MPGIYASLNIGKSALLTQQLAMEVAGHNIANVNTEGYSRQRLLMATNTPVDYGPGQIGTGVHGAEVRRVADNYVSGQIDAESRTLGWWQTYQSALEGVESLFSDYGLGDALCEFFNAWEDLANNPEGDAERTVIKNRAEALTDLFGRIDRELEKVRSGSGIDGSIGATVDQINQISEEIAGLNEKIAAAEIKGQNANDYRDSRDLLLRKLSSTVDVQSYEDDTGRLTVMLADGRPLVDGGQAYSLDTGSDASGGRDIVYTDSDGSRTTVTESVSSGRLGGWLAVRDGDIADFAARLDDLADTVVAKVNALHSAGYGMSLDPATGQPAGGIDFFTGSGAGGIAVNEEILDDIRKIAAASDPSGVPGDNRTAIAIAELRNVSGIGDVYGTLVADVGSAVKEADRMVDHQGDIVSNLETVRESSSGVSLDEEMISLIQYQHAYEAAAKLIKTCDEMLTTVISMR